MEQSAKRLNGYLSDIGRRFPNAGKQVDELRGLKGKKLPDWPDWCFLPIAGYLVIAQNHGLPLGPAIAGWPARLAALAAWRFTKGVYCFDEGIYDALWETPIDTLPTEILYQLPEWCLYLETPRRTFLGYPLYGVFVHLEHDVNTGRPELRFLMDIERGSGPDLIPGVVHLNHPTLNQAIEAATQNTREAGRRHGVSENLLGESLKVYESLREIAGPVISLMLYLCSRNAEIRSVGNGDKQPGLPQPSRTKRGPRLFGAEKICRWECGWRTGAAIRQALESEGQNGTESGGRTGPRPHVRRAHWHRYRVGPREDGKLELRWLPPIAVNANSSDDVIPTLHSVQ